VAGVAKPVRGDGSWQSAVEALVYNYGQRIKRAQRLVGVRASEQINPTLASIGARAARSPPGGSASRQGDRL
jgi:hypothetical protein